MPNWCNNVLILNEDSNDSILKVLKDYIDENGNLVFDRIMPMPEELRGTTSPTPDDMNEDTKKQLILKYGADNWWDWCVQNWGTKWEPDCISADDGHVSFSTAWSPPIGIVKQLSKLTGRDFRLTYIEEGMDFCGEYFSYKNYLENQDCEYSPISNAPEKLREELCGEDWTWEEHEEEDEQ